jgi:enoyl-CoA hydratase
MAHPLPVLLAPLGHLLLATLNRPAALNALTPDMLALLAPIPSTPASLVVLRGAGGRAFCAGGDVRAIAALRGMPSQFGFFTAEYALDWALARDAAARAPHVALFEGVVMGGGVGISAHATRRVATERTLWAMPETALGLLPDVGASFFLPRLPHRGLGALLALTGARLAGADAVHAGVATHFVPAAAVEALVADLAAGAPPPSAPYAARLAAADAALARHATPRAALPPFSLGGEKAEAIAAAFGPVADAGGGGGGGVRGLLARLGDEAARGGARAALAAAALGDLARASPTAVAVTAESLRRGSMPGATLGGCLAADLRVVRALLRDPTADFYEGVRAVLVDKGKGAPAAWLPPTADAVEDATVHGFFDAPGPDEDADRLRLLGSHV